MPSQLPLDIAGMLEAAMLICFGFSWPIAIMKTLRVKETAGKSLGFLVMVLIGYLAGIGAKFAIATGRAEPIHWVASLYALNAMMVATEITLYLRYRRRSAAQVEA